MKKILLSTIVVALVLGSMAWFMRIEILLQLVNYRYSSIEVGEPRDLAWQQGPVVRQHSEKSPNIILIVADDLGYNDISTFGGGIIQTPGIDRLAREDMDGIVDIQMARLLKRLAARKINLELDAAAKQWLADEGYDPVFGARPLKRVIQRALQDQLAEMLLSGDVVDGSTVHISAGPSGLLVGDRISASTREAPEDAVVH